MMMPRGVLSFLLSPYVSPSGERAHPLASQNKTKRVCSRDAQTGRQVLCRIPGGGPPHPACSAARPVCSHVERLLQTSSLGGLLMLTQCASLRGVGHMLQALRHHGGRVGCPVSHIPVTGPWYSAESSERGVSSESSGLPIMKLIRLGSGPLTQGTSPRGREDSHPGDLSGAERTLTVSLRNGSERETGGGGISMD